MKLRNLYLLHAIVALVFALALLLMTPVMLGLFTIDNTSDTRALGQLIAVELVMGGLITLFARDVIDSKARSAINYGNLVADVLGFVIALNATLTGVMGWFGYVLVAIYLLFALGFAYFQFFGPMD